MSSKDRLLVQGGWYTRTEAPEAWKEFDETVARLEAVRAEPDEEPRLPDAYLLQSSPVLQQPELPSPDQQAVCPRELLVQEYVEDAPLGKEGEYQFTFGFEENPT